MFGIEISLLTLPKANAAYTIANSARFISGNSDSLTRSVTASNRKTFTVSLWFKRGTLNTLQYLFNGSSSQGNGGMLFDTSSGGFGGAGDNIIVAANGAVALETNALFRDPAAWTHAVLAVDTTQATAANRIKLYINGVQVTSFLATSYPAQNTDLGWNSTDTASIGRVFAGTYFFDGYMADFYNIDGAQLAPTCFGAVDANGYWRPITYSTASPCAAYGTNGFHLLFGNSAALGTDSAGSNNWTVNGLVAADQVIDTPTNSFATISPIDKGSNTITQGNLAIAQVAGNYPQTRAGFSVPTSGKWYWEVTIGTLGYINAVGVITNNSPLDNSAAQTDRQVAFGTWMDSFNGGVLQYCNNQNLNACSNWTGATNFAAAGVVQVAVDMDNGKMWFGKNGTWINTSGTANPATGVDPRFSDLAGTQWMPVLGGNSGTLTANFGQGGQSGLTYDSASGGTFKYTPPSGFKALSTSNLPEPTIAVPKNYFDAKTYTGTGASLSITPSVAATPVVYTTTGTTTWVAPMNVDSVTYLVVGGGGGSSSTFGGGYGGSGGGGGGGVATGTISVVPGQAYTVAVGAGGTAGTGGGSNLNAGNGGNSVFGSVTAIGGGASSATGVSGNAGGSGGGTGYVNAAGGAGTAGQGNNGGADHGGGGGGASTIGSNGQAGVGSGTFPETGGAGGTGLASSVTGSSVTYGCGGGGGGYAGGGGGVNGSAAGCSNAGAGGGAAVAGSAGTANTGGGAGGAGGANLGTYYNGAAGGSGIVVITYTINESQVTGFTPDLVWIKDRSTTNAHGIFDSVRTATKYWSSNASTAETTSATSLTAFLSNGFSLGTNALFNTSANSYISWLWKESATAGMDIVTYTGDNTANRNISHSLGVAPHMVIVKRRDSAGDPYVWHTGLTGATYFTLLDSTAAQSSTNSPWGTGSFGASTFMVTNNATNNLNVSGATYVAYLFKGIDGFSKFGTYTGNGSADGPFIYTGFKPRYVMVKRTDSTSNWEMFDTTRFPYNGAENEIYANLSSAESGSVDDIDMLSNGFKIRRSSVSENNATGGSYIYAAFAEQPFKYSAASTAAASTFVQAVAFLIGMVF